MTHPPAHPPVSICGDLSLAPATVVHSQDHVYKPARASKAEIKKLLQDVKAITFDLDDTLWEIRPVIDVADIKLQKWLEKEAPQVAERFSPQALAEIRQVIAQNHPEMSHDFTKLRTMGLEIACTQVGFSLEEAKSIAHRGHEHWHEARHWVVYYDDVEQFMHRLVDSGRFQLGALSNGNANIRRLEFLKDKFHFSFSAAEIGKPKPHPDMFVAAMNHTNLEPKQVLHIGDNPKDDVHGAASLGMITCWVNRNSTPWPAGIPSPPHFTITTFDELWELLE